MPKVSPSRFAYFRILYSRGMLTITGAQVKISGLTVSASASILAVNAAEGSGYEDLIVDFLVTFNTPVAGTLQEIYIAVSGPTLKGATPILHFCSAENITVPQGTVSVTKRFIVRWYTG
jgi:hypothetical protein